MRFALCLTSLLVACTADSDRNPYRPPGGPTTGMNGNSNNGGPAGSDAGVPTVSGVICVVKNLRLPTDCDGEVDLVQPHVTDIDIGDLTPANLDGFFSIPTIPTSPRSRLLAEDIGQPIRPSVTLVPLSYGGAGGTVLPLISQTAFDTELLEAGLAQGDDLATLVVHMSYDGTPVAGAEVTPIAGAEATYYDVPNEPYWSLAVTSGALGAALIANIPLGQSPVDEINIQLTSPQDGARTIQVPLVADATTFVSYDFYTEVY